MTLPLWYRADRTLYLVPYFISVFAPNFYKLCLFLLLVMCFVWPGLPLTRWLLPVRLVSLPSSIVSLLWITFLRHPNKNKPGFGLDCVNFWTVSVLWSVKVNRWIIVKDFVVLAKVTGEVMVFSCWWHDHGAAAFRWQRSMLALRPRQRCLFAGENNLKCLAIAEAAYWWFLT